MTTPLIDRMAEALRIDLQIISKAADFIDANHPSPSSGIDGLFAKVLRASVKADEALLSEYDSSKEKNNGT